MRLSVIIFQVVQFLLPPFLILNAYLYLFPIIQGCDFPLAKPAVQAPAACWIDGTKPNITSRAPTKAPFRLLVFADPQIEGDTSLPNPNDPTLLSLKGLSANLSSAGVLDKPRVLSSAVSGVFTRDIPRQLKAYRKRLDLLGNDYYLARIYRSVKWWSQPTHMTVLGDLVGSQWMNDEEFERRSDRFWNRIFKGASRVPERVMSMGELEEKNEIFLHGRLESLDDSGVSKWKDWLINVVGNHDIGYAGDLNEQRVARFEKNFGKVNWETRIELSSNESTIATLMASNQDKSSPKLRLIMLNSMNLDSPAWSKGLQEDTHGFLSRQMGRTHKQRPEDATILLTHIPLYKERGVCVDGPYFTYWPEHYGGGLKEQNHLTEGASENILDDLFAVGGSPDKHARGIILNGHDHEGCDTYHYQLRDDQEPDLDPPSTIGNWTTAQYPWSKYNVLGKEARGIREITVRSMMGSYGGNVGMLSAWFDEDLSHWQFEYASCSFGVQHVWWGINVFSILYISAVIIMIILAIHEEYTDSLSAADIATEKKTQ